MGHFTERMGANITKFEGLIERLESEEFVLIAVGRPLLGVPALVNKIRE